MTRKTKFLLIEVPDDWTVFKYCRQCSGCMGNNCLINYMNAREATEIMDMDIPKSALERRHGGAELDGKPVKLFAVTTEDK